MKKLKALSILIFIFGLSCILFSGYMLFTLEGQLQLWEELQRAGMEGAQKIRITNLRAGLITSYIWIAIVGVLSAVSGAGLFLMKNWARKLWLVVLLLQGGTSLYQLVDEYQKDLLGWASLISFLIFGAIIIAMLLYFTRQKTQDHFRS